MNAAAAGEGSTAARSAAHFLFMLSHEKWLSVQPERNLNKQMHVYFEISVAIETGQMNVKSCVTCKCIGNCKKYVEDNMMRFK